MKDSKIIIPLRLSEINIISKNFKKYDFKYSTHLFYEGQIPCCAYYISKGNLFLLKKRKVVQEVSSGHLLAFSNFINKRPIGFSTKTERKSELFIIDKYSISKIFSEANKKREFIERILPYA